MQLAYETYLQKKETTMYILHDFQVHGKFRLNEDNVVLHIISTKNSNDKQVRWREKKKVQNTISVGVFYLVFGLINYCKLVLTYILLCRFPYNAFIGNKEYLHISLVDNCKLQKKQVLL